MLLFRIMPIVFVVLIVTLATFVAGNLVGYLVHRAMHCRWFGKAYADHLHHHRIYPPNSYLSSEYRLPPIGSEQGKYYLLAFLVMCAPLALWHWGYFALAFMESVAVLKLYDWLHDVFHIRGHWLEGWSWFRRLRENHFQHHVDVRTNFGILVFFPDKVMRTFAKPEESSTWDEPRRFKTRLASK